MWSAVEEGVILLTGTKTKLRLDWLTAPLSEPTAADATEQHPQCLQFLAWLCGPRARSTALASYMKLLLPVYQQYCHNPVEQVVSSWGHVHLDLCLGTNQTLLLAAAFGSCS